MKIKTKIFLSFLISGLALTLLGVAIFYYPLYTDIKNRVYRNLSTIAELKGKQAEVFIEKDFERMNLVAGRTQLRIELREYLKNRDEARLDKIKSIIMDAASSIEDFQDIYITNTQGEFLIFTAAEVEREKELLGESFFGEVSARDMRIILDENGEPVIYLFTPLEMDNKILGKLIIKGSVEDLFDITLERSGLGETGESYIINSDYYMLTPSFFIDNAVLKQKVDTVNAQGCFVESNTEKVIMATADKIKQNVSLNTFKDYRGEEVFGSHRYITETDWCLLLEIDKKEAFAPLNRLTFIALLVIIILFLLIYIIASVISRNIITPLNKFKNIISDLIKYRNWDQKVDISTNDESAELARLFNKMTDAVEESRREIKEKVKKQTQEIQESKKQLEDQQKAVLNILEDVDEERKKAAQERDRINTILQSIGDGVFVLDQDKRIILFNKAAERLSGYSVEEVKGDVYNKKLKFVFDKTGKENKRFVNEPFETGGVRNIRRDTSLIQKKGEKLPIFDSSAAIKNERGDVVGCVVVFHDVTKEREISKMKTEFVSVASHQLRTPLTTIKWYLEDLATEELGDLNVEQEEYINIVHTSLERMIRLINDLLNVSRLEEGRLTVELEPTDLIKLTKSVIADSKALIKEYGVQIKTGFPDKLKKVKIDPTLIRQVLNNLISNSVKYSQEDKGKVLVSLKKRPAKRDVLFKIKDNGIGIPEEEQRKIFKKFFRADNVIKKETEGTGLGLYIAKLIVEVSGGEIWFESKEDRGTTFYFTLPLNGSKAHKGDKKLAERKQLGGKK